MSVTRHARSIAASLSLLALFAAGCNGGSSEPTIVSFTAPSASIKPGASATLTWDVGNATSVTIEPGVGPVSGTSVVVTPRVTTVYTLIATNGTNRSTATATVTVIDDPPRNLSYGSNPAVYTKGVAVAPNLPSSTGGAVVTYAVIPALPAGLSLDSATGVISGTPTAVAAEATYSVSAANAFGITSTALTLTVKDVAPSSLSYAQNPVVYTKGAAITANAPTVSGGAVTLWTASPALPAGLFLDPTTGVITGTPTLVAAQATYVVTASNSGGSTTANLVVTVNDVAPRDLAYTSPVAYTRGTAIAPNVPSSTGGLAVAYAVSPSLPAGLSLGSTTGVISGTPSAISAAAAYVVTATNSGGAATASVSIAVNELPPRHLTYSLNPAIYMPGTAITPNFPTQFGGPVASWAVAPALPAGLVFNTATGILSGTPTTVTPTGTYVVTATNSGGSTTLALSITVIPDTHAISGTVSGAWGEDVLVTLGGAGSATTRTDANGAYSFTGLGDGSYTVTPELPGYTYAPVAPTVVLAGANATQDFVASSTTAAYSISGTVAYSGTRGGPIYVNVISAGCLQCTPVASTAIAGPGPFTVRGLQGGRVYQVVAWRDFLLHGTRVAADPAGSTDAVSVGTSDVTGVAVSLTDPAPVAPQTPAGLSVFPGDGGAAVVWGKVTSGGLESATGYRIYSGTDVLASNRAPVDVPVVNNSVYMQGNVTNGDVLYYKISSLVDGTESATSAVVGPITIGPTAGANLLTGTVTFGGTATGPLYIAVFDQMAGVMRSTKIAAPVSPQPYSVPGIPSGDAYSVFVILDQANSGVIEAGNPNNTNRSRLVAINGATTRDVVLSGANAEVRVNSEHQMTQATSAPDRAGIRFPSSDRYVIRPRAEAQAKLPVAVMLYSGTEVTVPSSLAKYTGVQFESSQEWTGTRPTVGGTYGYKIWYADGTSELKSGTLNGVLDAMPLSLGVTQTPSANVPTFHWLPPASPPVNYGYHFSLWNFAGADWGYPQRSSMPSSQTTLQYNADGKANPASLVTGSLYNWSVRVEDEEENQAIVETTYYADPLTTLTQTTSQDVTNGIGAPGGSLSVLRVFDTSAGSFLVSQVQFGLWTGTWPGGGEQPFIINLYSLDGPLTAANMTLVGTANATFPGHPTPSVVSVDVSGLVLTGKKLVAEVVANGTPALYWWAGVNSLGQSAPCYYRLPPDADPVDIGTVDPTWHLVLNVLGTSGP